MAQDGPKMAQDGPEPLNRSTSTMIRNLGARTMRTNLCTHMRKCARERARNETGTTVHRYTSTPVFRYTNTPIHRYTSKRVSMSTWSPSSYTGNLVHWYNCRLVHPSTDISVQQFASTPVHKYTNTLIHRYTGIRVHCHTDKYTSTPVNQIAPRRTRSLISMRHFSTFCLGPGRPTHPISEPEAGVGGMARSH